MTRKAANPAPYGRGRAAVIAAVLFAVSGVHCAHVMADVRIIGLDDRQEANARAGMQLAEAPCDTPAWQRDHLATLAPRQINNGLEALGHYRAEISSPEVVIDDDCWEVTFRIEPGPRVTFETVRVDVLGEASNDPEFARLIAESPLVVGGELDHGEYEALKRSLTSTAADRGYFEARLVRNEIVVDADGRHASVALQLESGPRYSFGEVSFKGDFVAPSVLKKFSDIESGGHYDTRQLSATHSALLATGYFQYINIDANPANAVDLVVPVVIELAPAKKRSYSGGLGFATDSGPRFRLKYRNRRVNRRGHTLTGGLLYSPVQSQLGSEYRIPLGEDRRELLLVRGGFKDEDTDTSESQSVELSVRYARGRGAKWLETLFVEALYEDYKIASEDSTSRLIVPGINWWTLTGTTRPRQPGHRLFFELRGTSQALGSDTSYIQAIAQAKKIMVLGERTRLLARIDLGTTAKDSLSELPPSARFFAGGDSSVRGYAYESIGDTDENGEVIGGSHLIAGSLELDWAINERWSVAVFADSGSAYGSDAPDFSTGIGFGVRRSSPLGPLRIDLAHPLDLERSVRLHISFGPEL